MSAEADAVCGAPYGMPSADRLNVRNGYRHRDFDTRAGTLDVAAAANNRERAVGPFTTPARTDPGASQRRADTETVTEV